jgi:hypothetical protein
MCMMFVACTGIHVRLWLLLPLDDSLCIVETLIMLIFRE